MKRLLSQIISAIAGLWISALIIPGVSVRLYAGSNLFGFPINYQWQLFLTLGLIIGLLNYFARPFLRTFSLPFETIALEICSIIIGFIFLWILQMIFAELTLVWYLPIIYTTLIIWVLYIIISKLTIHE